MVKPLTGDEIVAALKRWGIPYREQTGWRARANSRGWGDVTGFMWHHTGDDAPDSVDLKMVTEGRTGLPGPLCNFGLADDGTVWLVAAGAANHAGGGDELVLAAVRKESYTTRPPAPRFTHQDLLDGKPGAVSGNPLFYGVECFYYAARNPKQRAMMPRLAAAIIDALDRKDSANSWTAKSGIGHKEWQRGKIDPTYDCVTLRAETQALLDAGPIGDDMTPEQAAQLARIEAKLNAQIPERYIKKDPNDPTGARWIVAKKGEAGAKIAPVLDELHGNTIMLNISGVDERVAELIPKIADAVVAKLPAGGASADAIAKATAAEFARLLGVGTP